jgi:cytochrome c oxidase subunit 2
MLAGVGITLISLWFGQNHGLLPAAASKESLLVDQLFNAMMVIAIGLFILVQGALIVSAIKFRRRPGDETDGPPIHGNIPLEILWTAIPAVIVLGIGVYSFDVYMAEGSNMDPMGHGTAHHASQQQQIASLPVNFSGAALAAPLPDDSLPDGSMLAQASGKQSNQNSAQAQDVVVNVTGLQYAWLFSYPDSGIVSGELHVPVNKLVQLNLNANDVIHAFWVPQFRLKQDVIPGQQTELRFTATQTGDYPVICAELCGSYHGGMKTRIFVQPEADYQAWVQSQVASQQLDSAIAAQPTPETLSDSDFLTPYTQELGVQPKALEQVASMSNHVQSTHTHHFAL